jgi:hypothetical protein
LNRWAVSGHQGRNVSGLQSSDRHVQAKVSENWPSLTNLERRLFLVPPQLQHLGLDLDVISVSLRARRLLPLASQVSQVGNAPLIERESVTLPLDHAFGFELADVGPAAIEVQRQRRADGRGLSGSRSRDRLSDGRAMATVSVISVIPVTTERTLIDGGQFGWRRMASKAVRCAKIPTA